MLTVVEKQIIAFFPQAGTYHFHDFIRREALVPGEFDNKDRKAVCEPLKACLVNNSIFLFERAVLYGKVNNRVIPLVYTAMKTRRP